MKTKILFFVFLFSLSILADLGFAQSWTAQNTGTSNFLTRVRFVNPLKGFAVGVGGLVLKTTNGGASWSQVSVGTNQNLGGLSFSDELHGTIVGSNGTILRTNDGGATWSFQHFDVSGLYESHLQAVHFFDENNGVISGCWGLTLLTTNGGANWTRRILPTSSWFAGMHFPDSQTGYIVGAYPHTVGEVLKTTNRGITWFPVLSNVNSGLWGVYFTDANNGVVSGIGKILRTTNGGQTWTDQTIPQIAGSNMDAISFINQNTGFIVGQNGFILKTTNGGINWTVMQSGGSNYLTDIHFVDQYYGWIAGGQESQTSSVILKYNPLLPGWYNITQSYTGGHRGLFFTDRNTGWLVGYQGEVKKTTNGGTSWVNQTPPPTEFLLSTHFTDANNGWAVGFNGGAIKTTNGGTNWSYASLPIPSDYYFVYFTKPSNGYIGGRDGLVLRTTNGGSDWFQVTTPAPYSMNACNFISYNVGWIAGEGGYIVKTTNGGTNWTAQTTNTIESFTSIYFTDENYGWAVGYNGVIVKTTNGGATWSFQNGGYNNILSSVYFIDRNYGWITGTEGLLLGTTDGGATWLRYNSYTSNALGTISFPDARYGYIVGDNIILKYENLNTFLTLLQPKSYDELRGGDLVEFKWTYKAGSFANVKTEYSTDGGATWTYYNQFPAGYGSAYWNVPNTPSDNCFFRIYNADDPTLSSKNRFAFTILPKLRPENPTIIYPSDYKTGVPLTPTFHWNASERSVTYTIEIWDTPTHLMTTLSNIAGTYKDIDTGLLVNNHQYYWRVKGVNQYGESGFSNFGIFTTSATGNGNYLIPILSYPRGGQTVYSLSPTMGWYLSGNNTGLTGYELQYSTSLVNFENTCNTIFNIPVNDYIRVIGPLQYGTRYFWRMRSVAGTNYSAFSGIDSFVTYGTQGGVIKPIVSWPRDTAYVYTLKPELKWYLPTTPLITLKYKVKFGTDPTLAGATEIDNISDLFIVLQNSLQPNTKYYWAVCSYNGTTFSDYSDIAAFKTQPNSSVIIPIASWPRLGAMVYTNSPLLSWYLPSNGTNLTYKVKYSKDSNNTLGVSYIDNITGLQTIASNLDPGEKYYWQVCSYDGVTYSAYSTPIESFVVQGQIGPEKPIASWPRYNQILYLNNTKFDWYMPTSSQGITSYTVQYSLDAGFTSPTTYTNITEQYKYVSGLLPGTSYYWRVRAYKGALESDWSDVAEFRTDNSQTSSTGPTPAAAGWPRGGATVYSNAPILNWYLTNSHVGVVSFLLKYSTNPDMSAATERTFPVNVTSTTLSGLTYGQTYYWTIQSFDGTTYSTFDPPESFVVYVPAPTKMTDILAIPSLVVPMGGNVIYQKNIELSWKMNTHSNATSFELEYANNKEFTNSKIVTDITSTNYKLNNLENYSTYYWRVKSKSSTVTSSNSFTGYFRVNSVTDVKEPEVINSYSLGQNYPNPFNPSTIINYQIPKNGLVTLKVYDLMGREIETLVSKEQTAGKYSVEWNASKYSSGVYYYELSVGEFRSIKKMILMK